MEKERLHSEGVMDTTENHRTNNQGSYARLEGEFDTYMFEQNASKLKSFHLLPHLALVKLCSDVLLIDASLHSNVLVFRQHLKDPWIRTSLFSLQNRV